MELGQNSHQQPSRRDRAGTQLVSDPACVFDNPYQYIGRQLDIESGLYYYRARYYDAQLGRFIGRDPIEYGGGWNLYQYVSAAPSSQLDPHGLAQLYDHHGWPLYLGGANFDQQPAFALTKAQHRAAHAYLEKKFGPGKNGRRAFRKLSLANPIELTKTLQLRFSSGIRKG